MWEKLLQLIDRLVAMYFVRRATKSEVLQKTQEKLIEDIKKRDAAHSRIDNADIEYTELCDNEFMRK
jgi:hypothetical protein